MTVSRLVRGCVRRCVTGAVDFAGGNLFVNNVIELESLLIANGVIEADTLTTWDSIWPVLIDPDTTLAW